MDELGGDGATTEWPGRVAAACLPDDAHLIDRVRVGDPDAYGALFERYAPAARRLARRLCRDAHEADDVVSEVFANTLRAIRNGGGPVDRLEPYVLRSIRHTVAKLRTRTDTGRATPTETADLDRPAVDGEVALAGPVAHAFADLPPRFQDVLWMTCVEGRSAGEIGATGDLDAGAVASLAHRARRALGRSYLSVATRGPVVGPGCAPIRDLLPGFVQGGSAPATVRRVGEHLERCAECTAVSAEMSRLNRSLASVSTLALAKALVSRWKEALSPATAIGSGTIAPLAAVAVISGTLVGGGASVASVDGVDPVPAPVALPLVDADPAPLGPPGEGPAAPDEVSAPEAAPADGDTRAAAAGDVADPSVGAGAATPTNATTDSDGTDDEPDDARQTTATPDDTAPATAAVPSEPADVAGVTATPDVTGVADVTGVTATPAVAGVADVTGTADELGSAAGRAAADALDTISGATDDLLAANGGAAAETLGSTGATVADALAATDDVNATGAATAVEEIAAIRGTAAIEPPSGPPAEPVVDTVAAAPASAPAAPDDTSDVVAVTTILGS